MVFNDPICRGQPQTGSFADFFCCKKRLKDSFQCFFIHTDSAVGNRNFHISSPFDLIWLAIIIAEANPFCLNVEFTPIRHGMPGIQIKVNQNLFNLPLVHLHLPEIFLQSFVYGNFLSGAGKHAGTLFNHFIDACRSRRVFTLAGKSKELFGKVGCAHDVFFNSLDIFFIGAFSFRIQPHQGQISLNPHENVVKIMCDSPGQRADGLHLLGMDQLGFEVLLFFFSL